MNTLEMPAPDTSLETIEELLDAARVAPSAQNTQPWRFRVGPGRIDVFAEESRRLHVADEDGREMLLSIGCAIESIAIAAERSGMLASVDLFPRPGREDLVATLRFRRRMPGDPFRDPALFDALPLRHTNRGMYTGASLPAESMTRLRESVVEEGVGVFVTEDPSTLENVACLVADADRELHANPAFRRERARTIGAGAFGMSRLQRGLMRLALPHIDLGGHIAERNAERMRTAGAAAVIVSLTDDRASRVRAGQVVLRFWLLAAHLGLAVQPMSSPLQVPRLRRGLGRSIGTLHACPQHLLRLGYAPPDHHEVTRLDFASVVAA